MGSDDPSLFPVLVGLFAGPETTPQESVSPDLLEQIRAA
jgi:hypothetical protein